MSEKVEIKVHQVWQSVTGGRQVRIEGVDSKWDDVYYRNLKTRKKGQIFAYNLRKFYVLVQDQDHDD